MPDGDIVHEGLSSGQQVPYKQICEGCFSMEAIAFSCLKDLKRKIESFGDEPFRYIDRIVDCILPFVTEPLLKTPNDRIALGYQIEEGAGEIRRQVAANAARKACEQLAHEVQTGRFSGRSRDLRMEAYVKYIMNIHSVFEARSGLNPNADIDSDVILDRLKELRPYVREGVAHLVQQRIKAGSNSSRVRLMMPKRTHRVDRNTEIPVRLKINSGKGVKHG